MPSQAQKTSRHLVLAGGGHSHLEVLRQFGRRRPPDVTITLISRDRYTGYSGMLPGLVAGHYRVAETHFDLRHLCRYAGVRFIEDEITGLDPAARLISCQTHAPVAYDLLSINSGSVPSATGPGIPVKPVEDFLTFWNDIVARIGHTKRPHRIGIVGAGAGGVEIILAMHHALHRSRRVAADHPAPRFILIGRAATILPNHSAMVQRKFERLLARRTIEILTGQTISSADASGLHCTNGAIIPLDEIVWITGARPPPWLDDVPLMRGPHGFIAVGPDLRCLSDPAIFAAGDVADIAGHDVPKSGVYAVRQGAPLAENLRRALASRPLRSFHPQRHALALISTGDRSAVATRGSLTFAGPLVWYWKDWVDRRFMKRYQNLS